MSHVGSTSVGAGGLKLTDGVATNSQQFFLSEINNSRGFVSFLKVKYVFLLLISPVLKDNLYFFTMPTLETSLFIKPSFI